MMERLTERDANGVARINPGYCEAAAVMGAAQRLAAYEDAEEQGRLVVLPIIPGETFYNPRYTNAESYERDIREYVFTGSVLIGSYCSDSQGSYCLPISMFGKTFFTTREEAEAALAAQKGDNCNGYCRSAML